MSGKGKVLFVLLCIGLALEIPVTSSYSSRRQNISRQLRPAS